MNFKLKSLIVLFISIIFIYTACKKSNTNPSTKTLSTKSVSSQVALNISGSLFGSGGAFNITKGINAPTTYSVHTKQRVVNDLNNIYCGKVIDTTLNYTFKQNDTTVSITGSMKFTFICVNNVLTGFNTDDVLNINLTSSQLIATEKVSEKFTLLSLNPSDSNSQFSINGTLSSNASLQYKASSDKNGTAVFSYTLNTLIIDPNADSDVVSGSATFATSGTSADGAWNYSGTIVFLGNHLATITINNIAYNVNLQTGVVS